MRRRRTELLGATISMLLAPRGIYPGAGNTRDGLRITTNDAFLEIARERSNLTILGRACVGSSPTATAAVPSGCGSKSLVLCKPSRVELSGSAALLRRQLEGAHRTIGELKKLAFKRCRAFVPPLFPIRATLTAILDALHGVESFAFLSELLKRFCR